MKRSAGAAMALKSTLVASPNSAAARTRQKSGSKPLKVLSLVSRKPNPAIWGLTPQFSLPRCLTTVRRLSPLIAAAEVAIVVAIGAAVLVVVAALVGATVLSAAGVSVEVATDVGGASAGLGAVGGSVAAGRAPTCELGGGRES